MFLGEVVATEASRLGCKGSRKRGGSGVVGGVRDGCYRMMEPRKVRQYLHHGSSMGPQTRSSRRSIGEKQYVLGYPIPGFVVTPLVLSWIGYLGVSGLPLGQNSPSSAANGENCRLLGSWTELDRRTCWATRTTRRRCLEVSQRRLDKINRNSTSTSAISTY